MLNEIDMVALRQVVREEIQPFEERLTTVEQKVEAANLSREALREFIGDEFRHLDERMRERHDELVQRIEHSEGWIARRVRLEKVMVGSARFAFVALARRVLPFLVVFGGIMAISIVLYLALVR